MNKIFKYLTVFALLAISGCALSGITETDIAENTDDSSTDNELPEIDTTYIGQEHFASDEWLIVPLEDLPFQVQIPSWWTFSEDENSYTLTFDEGVLGEIIITKEPTTEDLVLEESETAPVYCYETIEYGESCAYINDECTEKKCVVSFDGEEKYPLIIWDKGLDENQKGIINELLTSFELD